MNQSRRRSPKAGSSASPTTSSRCRWSNIPAEGKDIFPTPNLKIDIPEDRWIRALEIRPSNREVTHHSVMFIGRGAAALSAQSGFVDVLGVWAVGTPPTVYPEGVGRWIRKGQQLRTNLHYHPNGTAKTDQTRVGLYFGKGELKKEVVSAVTGDVGFRIPRGREEPRDARALRGRSGHQRRVVLSRTCTCAART